MKAGYFAILKNACQRRWTFIEINNLLKSKTWKFVKSIPVGLVVCYTIVDCGGYVATVKGISMQPTLNPDTDTTDKVFINNWAVRNYQVQRGDIVSLKNPKDREIILIKRIVGLGGDVIRTTKKKEVKIPKGHCWVEGDNIKNSHDSNYFGSVPLGLICGKATRIVWPPSRMGKLHTTEIHDDRYIVKQSSKVTLFV